MSYFSSFRMLTFFLFVLMTAVDGGAIAGFAQSAPSERRYAREIDSLLENFKSPRPENYNSLKNASAGDVSANRIENFSPSAGELDVSLDVKIDSYPGNVRETALQPDGKILVGGYFRTVNGAPRKSIVRLNADNTLDLTFSATINGTVLAIAAQPDGKIVIGGSFTIVGGASRNRIARLNADGSLDASFNPGAGADALVYDVAIQTDGKILVGGNFFRVNSTNAYGIARLNADGSVDASFVSPIAAPTPTPTPPFQIPSIVYSIAVQSNGKIVIGGLIVLSYGNPAPVTTPIARLEATGAFDASFNPGTINSNAQKVAVQPDGKILMVGWFSTVNGVNRNYVARFNPDGSLDASFNIGAGASGPIFALFVQADGKILIGGLFNSFNGASRNRVARLNADGSLDASFNPGSGTFSLGLVETVIALPSGKVLIGGDFGGGFNFASDSIRVFNSDGSIDASVRFETTALGGVRAIAVQPDGKIIVGGNFNRPASGTLSQVFRLNADNSLDTTFGAGTTFSIRNGQINSIVVQPDGKILLAGVNVGGGSFLTTSIVRLNADGSTDNSFVPGNLPISRGANAVALQPDGKIVVVWGNLAPVGFPNGGVARLNADGSVDATFNSTLPNSVFDSVVIQTDGKILIGGPFSFSFINSQTGSVSYNGVVRLNQDGSRDTDFVPATRTNFQNNQFTEVFALAVEPDGKILVGGRIFTASNQTPTGIARLNPNGSLDTTFNSGAISSHADIARVEDIFRAPNGKILIGGLFNAVGSSPRTNVARLNADGSADNSFNARTDNTVYEIVAQADGKVLIGGDFETVNDVPRTSLARLLSEPVAAPRTRFDFDGDGKADLAVYRPSNGTWYLLNSQSGFAGAAFGVSTDRIVPADYDGDGKTDIAVYRAGTWYLQRSASGFIGAPFGAPDDVPQPADYDGDGLADLAVFRPSNGTWYIYNLATGQTSAVQFGASEDKPVAADYDGDWRADVAVFRPSNGTWYLQRSNLGFVGLAFGEATDKPVPADYDGDGKTDIAVFRPANGAWYLQRSASGFVGAAFGASTDLPVPADYDGDGKADLAVYRSSNGTWYLQRSQSGFTGVAFGASGDKPVPNAFIP